MQSSLFIEDAKKLEGNMANAEEDALTIAPDVAEYAMPLHH
jgi:hypothetical protein